MYSRDNPFLAKIKERYSLCKKDSDKQTDHIVLDLSGSGLTYNVGDCVAILPPNALSLVKKVVHAIEANLDQEILDRRTKKKMTLCEFLMTRANLKEASRKLKKFLNNSQEEISVLEALGDGVRIDAQEFCHLLSPQLPRYYSIASSMSVVGDEAHLTVSNINCKKVDHKLYGLCTDFLCLKAPIMQAAIPLYIHPHRGFTLPDDPSLDIIMIGPGTGVAPFRAFVQERERLHDQGVKVGRHWLFFGECHRSQHFFYEEYWNTLMSKGLLKLDVAFSRDQAEKIYVQHCMKKQSKDLYEWLQNGASIYVCGDATYMAKDVEMALLDIFKKEGVMSEEESKNYLRLLKSENRYLRDVY